MQKIAANKNRKFGGLMQRKLDEIEAKRKAEVAATEAAERRQRKREEARLKATKAMENMASASLLPGLGGGLPEGRVDGPSSGAGKRAQAA